jgi:hypothetical protein
MTIIIRKMKIVTMNKRIVDQENKDHNWQQQDIRLGK